MKYTHACPKCHASEIVRVAGHVGPYGSGNNIRYGPFVFNSVPVSRYVCLRCGFVEEWVDDPQDLAKIGQKYGQTSTA